MISFTGSTRAGALISKNAAQDFKRVSLELGGKGANIIFKDADPEAIERGAKIVSMSINKPMVTERVVLEPIVIQIKPKLSWGTPNKNPIKISWFVKSKDSTIAIE